jgi:hypothetical protein
VKNKRAKAPYLEKHLQDALINRDAIEIKQEYKDFTASKIKTPPV